ncbi:serum amyloid P-component-like [Eublepharis macularius]|uniref:Pentraxin family member n=1 Tax=Eublepharis macularius TaxID=481883 RepID=A0AA97KSV8_EUBMA|nr:serum amyloid P-component-like [Eublepharis macularius]
MSFIFPEEGDSYVTLKSVQGITLQNFTICLRCFTNLFKQYALFSSATKDQDRDIVIYKRYTGRGEYPQYVVCIGGKEVVFRVPDSFLRWQSSCVTWDSETGVITLWVDGYTLARRVVQKGYFIETNGLVILGKYNFCSPYGSTATFFSGEIKDVYMWNVTISVMDLTMTSWDSQSVSPIINWRDLQFEITGNVTLI